MSLMEGAAAYADLHSTGAMCGGKTKVIADVDPARTERNSPPCPLKRHPQTLQSRSNHDCARPAKPIVSSRFAHP
jgi:hypothetical protein